MSDRYSSSPTLRLKIGSSRLRAVLYGGLCVITCYALWAMYALGYRIPCLLLVPLAGTLLLRLRHDRATGALLCWQAGHWTLERGGERRTIAPLGRCTVTPWVIHLAFTDLLADAKDSLWLYADSAPPTQIRRLRVRLALLH